LAPPASVKGSGATRMGVGLGALAGVVAIAAAVIA
jgi:hypothetical protein